MVDLQSTELKLALIAVLVALIVWKFLLAPSSGAGRKKPRKPAESQIIRQPVLKASDLKDGDMTETILNGNKIMVYREKGEFFATGPKCSHHGANLKDGAFCNGQIRCPWHGATFSVRTGEIEDFPGPDCIPAFKATVEGDDVVVEAPIDLLTNIRVQKAACTRGDDPRTVVIVGGGTAGHGCAQTLRELNYRGRILIISKEQHIPYDRTKLSKSLAFDPIKGAFRSEEWYREHAIELLLGTRVTEVNTKDRVVHTETGESFSYTDVVICPGGTPRSLPSPGFNLGNIYQLRTPEDSNAIAGLVKDARVAIVGTSFIGMETAAAVVAGARSVHCIGMETVPFERVLGPQIGAAVQNLHETKGVQFHLKRIVKEFRGNADGNVEAIVLDNDEVIECDVAVVGAGVVCQTDFVKGGQVQIERDGSIITDRFMRAAEHCYVAGDVARYPYHLTGENIRVEHYGMAMTQGATAAHSIVGQARELLSVPVFWTTQYGKMIRYGGHALSFDEQIVEGRVEELSFAVYYVRKDQITAVVTMGKTFEPVVVTSVSLMANGRMPSGSRLKAAQDKINFLQSLL